MTSSSEKALTKKAMAWLAPTFLLLLFLMVRLPYHINFPFFEDEGIFLVDSRDWLHMYENSVYMKPPLGAFFYWVADQFFQSFLVLHLLTTLFILMFGTLLYRILWIWTRSYPIVLAGCLTYLYCTTKTVAGFGHSSIEHFQNVFLLASFWWFFVQPHFYRGMAMFISACLVLQNTILILPSLISWQRDDRRKMIILAVSLLITAGTVWLLFPNIIYNCFVFPVLHYGSAAPSGLPHKLLLFSRHVNDPILLPLTILSIPGFYFFFRKNARAALFILLAVGSVFASKPMFEQHTIAIFPLLILPVAMLFDFLQSQKYARFATNLMTLAIMPTIVLANQNAISYIQHQGFLKQYTFSPLLEYRLHPQNYQSLVDGLSRQSNKKVYLYPAFTALLYPLTHTKTISTFASNDQIWVIMKQPKLRNKLLQAIQSEKPDLLIRTEASPLDKFIEPILKKDYTCHRQLLQVCRLKSAR